MKYTSLQISAQRLRIAVLMLLALVGAAYAVARLGIDLGPGVTVESRPALSGAMLSLLPGDIAVVLFAFALWRLAQMLGLLANGQRFTRPVAAGFRSFAFWLLVAALAQIAVPLIGAVITATSGHGRIALAFDLRDVFFVIAALVLFLVARMLEDAAAMDAELKEIV